MFLPLKEMYKDKCSLDELPEHPNDYYWFKDDHNRLIGIHKTISPSEKKLISLMLEEIVAVDFDQHTRLKWLDFLLLNKTKILEQLPKTVNKISFIFFNHNFDSEIKLEFDALIKQFNDQFITLFVSGQYGVILDLTAGEQFSIGDLEHFVQAVQQDFYHSMNFYATESHVLDGGLTNFFSEQFELYQKYYNRHLLVMQQQDLLLQYLIGKVDEDEFKSFKEKIKKIPYDQIEVVKCYLENNFNLSFGAKILHMHRNTFMNKLERFILATDLNVKEFRDAVIAYLLIENLTLEFKM